MKNLDIVKALTKSLFSLFLPQGMQSNYVNLCTLIKLMIGLEEFNHISELSPIKPGAWQGELWLVAL